MFSHHSKKQASKKSKSDQSAHDSRDTSPHQFPLQRSESSGVSRTSNSVVIQRTQWKFDGTTWQNQGGSSSDTDTFPLPAAYCATQGIAPSVDDTYDQNTGVYFNKSHWAYSRKRAESKKRPANFGGGFFDKDREQTAYGFLHPSGPGTLQGPHVLAHTAKRSVFDLAKRHGFDINSMMGSKLAPSPSKARGLMKELLRAKHGTPLPTPIYDAFKRWARYYASEYFSFASGKRGSKKSAKRVLEAHPLTTYKLGGAASAAEIAGKNESAAAGLDDIQALLHTRRDQPLPSMTTLDTNVDDTGWADGPRHRGDFLHNYARAAVGAPPSPDHAYPDDSQGDSDYDDDDDDDDE